MNECELFELAKAARKASYSPYSGYKVGAALLCRDGRVFTGCNIESASYGATNCAERTAFFKAVSEGAREFTAIAIAGGKGDEADELCTPCGICRQVMTEFCDGNLRIICGTQPQHWFTLTELFPMSFSPRNLQ